jgi:hypothetical protein
MVPHLSPEDSAAIEIEKGFMLKHGDIKKKFDVSTLHRRRRS